jgi:hypothetical protein
LKPPIGLLLLPIKYNSPIYKIKGIPYFLHLPFMLFLQFILLANILPCHIELSDMIMILSYPVVTVLVKAGDWVIGQEFLVFARFAI